MGSDVIRSDYILEENHRVDDHLGFSSLVRDFKNRISSINTNSVVGLVGPFGSGKSTLLHQIEKTHNSDLEKWIVFDAWKYPERNSLWDGFVLDFANQIGQRNKIKKKIDAENKSLNTIGALAGIVSRLKLGADFFSQFINTFKSSPATRVFDIQAILIDLINKLNKELYIVVEDVDRSGDRGVFFLETLRNFIKENKFSKKIIVIAPLGDKIFDSNHDSYAKSLDYDIKLDSSRIDFSNFLEEVFNPDVYKQFSNFIVPINYLFKNLIRSQGLHIRDIKKILRNSLSEYQAFCAENGKCDIRFIIFKVVRSVTKQPQFRESNGQMVIDSSVFGYQYLIWIIRTEKIILEKTLQNFTGANLPIYLTSNNFDQPVLLSERDSFVDSQADRGCYLINRKYSELFQRP